MKCNHYNKFLSLSFYSISASLKTPLECIHSWVKHCSHNFATFGAFMVARWLWVWERWEEVCGCRRHHVLQLLSFLSCFHFPRCLDGQKPESDCILLGYLMEKFVSQPKSLIDMNELKKINSQLFWKGFQIFIREHLAVFHLGRL